MSHMSPRRVRAARPSSDLAASAERFDLSDDELRDAAKHAARAVQRLVAERHEEGFSPVAILRSARRLARRYEVALPSTTGLTQSLNRLCDAAWWRRALRKRFRTVEHLAIQSGAVHRHAAPYVSDRAMRRALRDRRRTAELLASMDAINQATGEVVPLEELVKQSLANPSNRRKAMMARIKGIEEHAKAKGHEALFLTITCPSRLHARRSTGARNERHDRSSPRDAQAYLSRVWRRAMRKLQHDGAEAYGMRVVEPHHDACPHWHVLVFAAPEACSQVIDTVRGYALCESPDEPGAAEHRFTVERIDPARGSAVGYVAKYVSKSIDGEGVEDDDESSTPGADASKRIVTWARVWNFRQFQFFGVPPITPTRELYRLANLAVPSEGLQAAHSAAKANDYGAWLSACESFGLRFAVTYSERPSSRYADETAKRIAGVSAQAADLEDALQLVTRSEEWRIEPRGGQAETADLALPWTRFNNCAPVDSIEVFAPNADALEAAGGRWFVKFPLGFGRGSVGPCKRPADAWAAYFHGAAFEPRDIEIALSEGATLECEQ